MFQFIPALTPGLIERFNTPGPYYTSYPTLSEWNGLSGEGAFLQALSPLVTEANTLRIGMYIHFPFCPSRCLFCICNSIITHDRRRVKKFMKFLFKELDMFFGFFHRHDISPRITEIHLGGGSPSFMTEAEFILLIQKLRTLGALENLQEFSIEADPRTTSLHKLGCYHDAGVNRVSFGIQDVDPKVQRAVNRVHSAELIGELLTDKVRGWFPSINFDLLYGLPYQTRSSFQESLESIKKLSPDRITLLRYAHVPDIRKHQRILERHSMPDDIEKAWIFFDTMDDLKQSGWEHIGIDHFAKSTDSLAEAQKTLRMTRTFIGFTTGASDILVGIGPTSTAKFGRSYFQNAKSLDAYCRALDQGRFPIERGYALTEDDLIRRDIINAVLCTYHLNCEMIEQRHHIDFKSYFAKETAALARLTADGLLERVPDGFRATDLGRGFLRLICRVFDRFLEGGKTYQIAGP